MNFRFGGDESLRGSDSFGLGTGGLLGSDAGRLGAAQESLRAQASFAQSESKRKAQQSRATSVGRITSRNADGTYEVTDTDGSVTSGCSSRKRASWQVGQWVYIEWVNDQPQIIGFAPVGAGSE